MKKYDLLIVGGGTGLDLASFADQKGLSVALVEEGPLGGTCLNRGCIPSKMLIHSADVDETIRNSEKFGIKSKIESVDFASIVKRVSDVVDHDSKQIEEGIKQSKNITWHKTRGKFIGPKQMEIDGEVIEGDKVFIVGGTRPMIPPVPGLDKIKYLTSTEALRLTKQPEIMVVAGGGYIACELAHFYGSLGTKIIMLVRGNQLLENEDKEISSWFAKEFSQKHDIRFNTEAENFSQEGKKIKIKLKKSDEVLTCDQVLIATGRKPNTDILDVNTTGVEMDEKGYIKVNEYLETNVKDIWAFGDIVGILPFKHTANDQLIYAIHNGLLGKKVPANYHGIPHAVFSSPQVAGVGKTEQELKQEGIKYRIGKYEYKATGMGEALQENGLVKILVDEQDNILGGHIVGPDASTLIQEIVIAMKTTGKVSAITDSVHVHPALSEVIQRAFSSIVT